MVRVGSMSCSGWMKKTPVQEASIHTWMIGRRIHRHTARETTEGTIEGTIEAGAPEEQIEV